MNNRQAMNKLVLELLIEANELMPDQRLGQLLINCEIAKKEKDSSLNCISYYEESYETLKRVSEVVERLLDADS